jgi:hypothetical protein
MLDWIGAGKADHPSADLKKVRELIAGLPSGNSLRALEEITSWLDALEAAQGSTLKHRLDAVDLLDRAAKYHQFKLAPEYLQAPRLQKLYESRLWNTSFRFWKSLGDGYLHCLEAYQQGAPGSEAIRTGLPRVAGRALRALTLQLKWVLLRYALIENRIWRDVGRAYRFAETHGFATLRAQVYPGKHGESSAQEEFLKALMLVASSPDGLPPVKIHIAERVIAQFANRFALHTGAHPDCSFRFDLSADRPPMRAAKDTTAGAFIRYFGAGEAADSLCELARLLREKDILPGNVYLGGDFDRKTVSSVLNHLLRYWAKVPPPRSSPRRDIATRVTIVPGFSGTLNWVKAVMDATSLEFSDPHGAESWIVFDASDGGYGTIIPSLKGDWLHVGCLVGMRAETSNLCRAGIVRRMTRDKYDQRRVGIEILETTAVPVAVSPSSPACTADSGRATESAILLSHQPNENRELMLLMQAGSFNPKRAVRIALPAGTYHLEPVAVIESGEDFDRARYRISDEQRAAA